MKRLLFSTLGAMCLLSAVAATKKPLPPCKWAGYYVGMSNPTAWPKNPMPMRTIFEAQVNSDYTITADTYNFGRMWQSTFTGIVSTSGSFRATNQYGTIATGVFGAHKSLTGSYVFPKNAERGTIAAYQEAILP